MSFRAKRELLAQVAPRYTEATHAQTSVILDEFLAATGYARKYAIRLLASFAGRDWLPAGFRAGFQRLLHLILPAQAWPGAPKCMPSRPSRR